MNSLKVVVSSWESLYPGKKKYDDLKSNPPIEDVHQQANDIEALPLPQTSNEEGVDTRVSVTDSDEQDRLDRELRTSADQGTPTHNSPSSPSSSSSSIVDDYDDDGTLDSTNAEGPARSDSIISTLLSYLVSVPMYILVKPLIFTWLLLTYPITLFFQSNNSKPSSFSDNDALKAKDEKSDPTTSSTELFDESAQEKIEKLKQENIISNTIKSPSLALKYLIPSPQRLFPLSRNPNKKKKKKTLILDLDETLIHSLSRGLPRLFSPSVSSNMIEIKLHNISSLYYVYKRPYCDHFLREAAKWFELQIFTASVKEYADPIINWLESEIAPYVKAAQNGNGGNGVNGVDSIEKQHATDSVFTKRFYRTDCTYRPGVGYIKDLLKFVEREDDLKNVVILDNLPVSYALHENNAVMIEGWINDQSDRDLLNLLPMLQSLSLCIDVRYVLGLRSGERVFEN